MSEALSVEGMASEQDRRISEVVKLERLWNMSFP